MPADIKADRIDLEYVSAVLRRLVPDRDVYAFGSRTTGRARQFSDLDLAIMGDAPVSPEIAVDLHDAFDESDLPFKVDILEWATASESFRSIVKLHAVPFVLASKNRNVQSSSTSSSTVSSL
jgi:type I restriction enzyme S subunit